MKELFIFAKERNNPLDRGIILSELKILVELKEEPEILVTLQKQFNRS